MWGGGREREGEKRGRGREGGGERGREREREREQKERMHVGERESAHFGSSFYMLFPPPGPALCKLGQPGVLLILHEVLTPVLGPSFVLFLWAFPFLVV